MAAPKKTQPKISPLRPAAEISSAEDAQPMVVGMSNIGAALRAQAQKGFQKIDAFDEGTDDAYRLGPMPKIVDGEPIEYVYIARDSFREHPHAQYVVPVTIDLLDKTEFSNIPPMYFDSEGLCRLGTRVLCYWPTSRANEVKKREALRTAAGIAIKSMQDREAASGGKSLKTESVRVGGQKKPIAEFDASLDAAATDEKGARSLMYAGGE